MSALLLVLGVGCVAVGVGNVAGGAVAWGVLGVVLGLLCLAVRG